MRSDENDKDSSYNDSMPINAVGKLIKNIDTTKTGTHLNSKKGFVKGFSEDDDRLSHNNVNYNKNVVKSNQSSHVPYNRQPQTARISETDQNNYDNDTNSNFSLDARPIRRLSANAQEREQRKRKLLGEDYEEPQQKNIEEIKPPHEHIVVSRDSRMSHEKPPLKQVQRQQPKPHSTAPQRKELQSKKTAKDPFVSKMEFRLFIFKMASLSVFIVTAIVMVFLIWQITSLQNQLQTAELTIAELPNVDELLDMQTILQAEIHDLNAALEIYRNNSTLDTTTQNSTNTLDEDSYISTNIPSLVDENITTTHIVQAGESISVIAQNVMGSTAHQDLLMQANGLTSPNISPGQELIIPPIP